MKAKRTWFYSPVLLVLLLVACSGASSDGQLIGEKITDWTATVSPGKVSSDKNEVHLHSKDVGPMGEVMATFTFVNDGTISGNGLSFQDGGKGNLPRGLHKPRRCRVPNLHLVLQLPAWRSATRSRPRRQDPL